MLSTNHVLAHIHMMRPMPMTSKPKQSIHVQAAYINTGDDNETLNAL